MLVHLVHRLADHAEFGDRTIVLDEARVGSSAGGAELRAAPRRRLHGAADEIAEGPGWGEERLAADGDLQVVAGAAGCKALVEPAPETLSRMHIAEADVEGGPRCRG